MKRNTPGRSGDAINEMKSTYLDTCEDSLSASSEKESFNESTLNALKTKLNRLESKLITLDKKANTLLNKDSLLAQKDQLIEMLRATIEAKDQTIEMLRTTKDQKFQQPFPKSKSAWRNETDTDSSSSDD